MTLPITDLSAVAGEIPVNTGLSEGFSDPGASFGELLVMPVSVDPVKLAADPGDTLPVDGNDLPQMAREVPPEPPPYPEIATLRLAVDLLPTAPPGPKAAPPAEGVDPLSASVTDTAVLAVDAPTILPFDTHPDLSEIAEVGTEIAIAQYTRESAAPVSNTPPVIERTRAPVVAPVLLATDKPTASMSTDRQGDRQVDTLSRETAAVMKVSAAWNDTAATPVIAESELATLTDRIDVVQKPASIAVSQVPSVVADSSLLLHGTSTPARPASLMQVSTHIDIPLFDDKWGEALNDRVLWMAGRTIKNAEIRMNPAELGPIRVQVLVEDDAAKISFSASHALTREAIEQALPRLREMLSENGISLANTTVSDSGVQHEQHARDREPLAQSDEVDDLPSDSTALPTPLTSRSTSALVDTFA